MHISELEHMSCNGALCDTLIAPYYLLSLINSLLIHRNLHDKNHCKFLNTALRLQAIQNEFYNVVSTAKLN